MSKVKIVRVLKMNANELTVEAVEPIPTIDLTKTKTKTNRKDKNILEPKTANDPKNDEPSKAATKDAGTQTDDFGNNDLFIRICERLTKENQLDKILLPLMTDEEMALYKFRDMAQDKIFFRDYQKKY